MYKPYNLFYYCSVSAVLLAVVFFIRGLRIIKPRIIYRYLIALLLALMSVVLWPDMDSIDIARILLLIILVFLIFLLLYDLALTFIARFKKDIVIGNISRQSSNYIPEIYKALQALAMQEQGALVIIERKDNLLSCLSGGIPFDSEIKAEVLFALFAKNSPVHDGGIIVKSGRISRLKSILPLSANLSLSSHLGTRHRAAIGITERTDAIAFVVSEERKEISVAYNGLLVKIKSRDHLAEVLKKASRTRKRNTKIKRTVAEQKDPRRFNT